VNGLTNAWVSKLIAWTFFLLFVNPTLLYAQRDDALEEMLRNAQLEKAVVDPAPVPKSSVSEVNLKVHWKLWKKVASEGKAGLDELQALEHDGRSLGHINQPNAGLAVAAIASSQADVSVGHDMFRAARQLAPQIPYVYFISARYALDREPLGFRTWSVPLIEGYRTAWSWPDTRFPWTLKFLLYITVAIAFASFTFVIGQTLRHFGILSYDMARALPQGFSSNQTVVLLLLALIVPTAVFRSMLLGILVLLALLSLTQNVRERVVSALIFLVVAALPTLDRAADHLASFSGSQAQQLVHAQYFHCDKACIEDVEMRSAQNPDDFVVQYTRLLAGYRTGETHELKRIVEVAQNHNWPQPLAAYLDNLAGASHIALGDSKAAIPFLNKARNGLLQESGPSFNLMRAHQALDDVDQASAAFKEAAARNLDDVTLYMRFTRRDVNSHLIVLPLPQSEFWAYHISLEREPRSVMAPWWTALAGPRVELEHATPAGGVGLLFLILVSAFRMKRPTSTPCPRCGMARDPGDDQTTGAHSYCLPCYRTFVTGAGLDYNARIYNETVLGRRERFNGFLRRCFCILVPGAGHHLAGRALVGFGLSLCLALGVLLALNPMGVIRPIHEIYSENWGGAKTLGWTLALTAAFSLIWAAIRGLEPLDPEKR